MDQLNKRLLKHVTDGKIPPQSVEVEEVVLGSMMLSKIALLAGMTMLTPESFYKLEHQKIFNSIKSLASNQKDVDILTVTDHLRNKGNLQISGGPGYITSLTNRIASDANFESHCFILKEKHMKRSHINFGHELVQKGFDSSFDVFDVNDYMLDTAYQIQSIGWTQKDNSISELAKELTDKIEKAAQQKGITGVSTGFAEQDALFGGWQPTDFIILGARPGMGKTAKALCDVLHMIVNEGKRVIFFSLEMGAIQLFQRLCAMHMRINGDKFKTGSFKTQDWETYHAKISDLITDRLIIVDDCYHINDIVNKTKRERLQGPVDCVYIDYLQLCQASGGNREQEISMVSRSCKMLAKSINAPVIGLSQLSRKLDERQGHRPRLADLRESGSLEQDADIVTFLHRPGYYDKDENPALAYLIVDKHRNGSLQDIELEYIHAQTLFISPGRSAWDNF